MVLETLAFQYTAQRISDQELVNLEKLVEKIEQAAEVGKSQMLAEYDYEFHERVCQASGWPRLYRIWEDQHVLLRLWFNVVAKSHGSFMQGIAEDHRRMIEAIKAKDQTKIAEEVFHHIYYSGPAYEKERAQWAMEAANYIKLQFTALASENAPASDAYRGGAKNSA